MARFSRNLRPVNSLKHIVDTSATLAAATQIDFIVCDAVQSPVLTVPSQTAIGARVGSIYLSVEAAVTTRIPGAIPNFYLAVIKDPSTDTTLPNISSVGTSDNKRFVIHQEMFMLTNIDGGAPRNVFRGVIKIPRGYARQGNDDRLLVSLLCPSLATAVCIQCIYKEYR